MNRKIKKTIEGYLNRTAESTPRLSLIVAALARKHGLSRAAAEEVLTQYAEAQEPPVEEGLEL